jgi:hypothetical protein
VGEISRYASHVHTHVDIKTAALTSKDVKSVRWLHWQTTSSPVDSNATILQPSVLQERDAACQKPQPLLTTGHSGWMLPSERPSQVICSGERLTVR